MRKEGKVVPVSGSCMKFVSDDQSSVLCKHGKCDVIFDRKDSCDYIERGRGKSSTTFPNVCPAELNSTSYRILYVRFPTLILEWRVLPGKVLSARSSRAQIWKKTSRGRRVILTLHLNYNRLVGRGIFFE